MSSGFGKILVCLLMVMALANCSRDTAPRLLNFEGNQQGPDEFGILPNRPLEAPPDFAALPEPTPGLGNRADANPEADAIAALGGRPGAVARSAPAADNGLLNHARRYGVSNGIRTQLETEDLEFRRRNDGRLLERLFNVNVYFRAYRVQSLDQYAELERFRRLGIRTPAAPPEPVE